MLVDTQSKTNWEYLPCPSPFPYRYDKETCIELCMERLKYLHENTTAISEDVILSIHKVTGVKDWTEEEEKLQSQVDIFGGSSVLSKHYSQFFKVTKPKNKVEVPLFTIVVLFKNYSLSFLTYTANSLEDCFEAFTLDLDRLKERMIDDGLPMNQLDDPIWCMWHDLIPHFGH